MSPDVQSPSQGAKEEDRDGQKPWECPMASGQIAQEGDRHRNGLQSFDDIPAPRPNPVIGWRGNLLRYLHDPISCIFRLHRNCGEVARLVAGPNAPIIFRSEGSSTGTVFALSSAAAQDVLTEPEIFGGGNFRAPEGFEWINAGLSAAQGERHHELRRIIFPAFDRSHLESYVAPVAEITARLLARWRASERIDMVSDMYDLATRAASTCFFGQSPDDRSLLAARVRRFAEGLMSPLAAIPLDLPGMPYRRLRRDAEAIRSELFAEIERKRRDDYRGDDMLAMMLAAGEDEGIRLGDDELLSNTVGIFLAGHDVPANAITFCLLLLSQHPEALGDLLAELEAEVDGNAPNYQQLWKLPVLDRVVKESLRLLAPTLTIFRRTVRPGSIRGYAIPPGTEVLVSPLTIHRDPDTYEDPLRFRPQRWLDHRPSAFEYLPFSYGTRRCVGASFGELMMKLVIALVVRKFRLTPRPGSKIDFSCTFVISPKSKIEFDLSPPDGRLEESRVPIRGQVSRLVDFSR